VGGSSKKVTVGYKYYLGIHMVLCHGPVDKLVTIEVDDKEAWSGNFATNGTININKEELFGGEQREGGISGALDVALGGATQTKNTYLQARLGSDIPAYRGVTSVILNQMYIGLNPYLKRWAFWVERIHTTSGGETQWYDDKAAIGTDMNPAHIIRECLTDPSWGMGYDDNTIDDTSFQAVADQLYDEGMGVSLIWDKSIVLEEFLQLVLKHIDGSLYVDRSTGLFKLTLARGGYDVDDLITLDEDNIQKISDFKRNTMGELVNSVTVIYWDGDTGNAGSVTVQDIALAAQQGATIGTTKQFPGFTKGELASQVASRSLKALSTPLASCTIYATRAGANLNVGDVFKVSWPRYGLTQTVMRVVTIEFGALGSNLIKIKCIEDVFALSSAIYAAPPSSEWAPPTNDPAPCPYHNVIEAPYWELVQRLGETEARAQDSAAGYVVVAGVTPTDDAINAKIWSNPTNTDYEEAGTVDFTPTALNSANVGYTDTVIALTSAIDVDLVAVNTYAVWENEIVRIDAISSTEMTVARGCLDTVPTQHSASARIFFSDAFFETDQIEYADGEVARIKLTPTTSQGTLDIASATEQTHIMDSRLSRPYPPGYLSVGGTFYGEIVDGDVDTTIAWRHRDRLQQTATIIGTEVNSDIGPEAGTTYEVEIRTPSNTLIDSASGVTGNNHTFTVSDLGDNYGPLEVRLWSVRDSLASFTTHEYTFTRTAQIQDRDLTEPPLTPTTGHSYIVASPATGDWLGEEDNIATYNGTTWDFATSQDGWVSEILDEAVYSTYDGTDWSAGDPV